MMYERSWSHDGGEVLQAACSISHIYPLSFAHTPRTLLHCRSLIPTSLMLITLLRGLAER